MKYGIMCAVCIITAILLSGCRPKQSLSKAVTESQDPYPELPANVHMKHPNDRAVLTHPELSLEEAVRFAIKHNPKLQARLENLGVAQSDIVQAGLYSNPDTELAVRSSDMSSQHNIEFETMMSISDLWHVPLRQQMAQDEYAAIQHSVAAAVLDTALEAKQAYIECMYALADKKAVYKMYQAAHEMRDSVYKRFEFGYTTDLDKHMADANVDRWYITYQRAQTVLENAFVQLENVLGVTHDENRQLHLSQPFIIEHIQPIATYDVLRERAYHNRPEIIEHEQRVNQYRSQIRYEQSQAVPHVGLGASFERELSGEHLRGPAISFEIPLFDLNQGNVSRAEYLKRKAQKELYTMQTAIDLEISVALHELQTLQMALDTYHNSTLTSISHGLSFASYYTDQKRMTVPDLIQTRLFMHETYRQYLNTVRQIWHRMAELERAVGADIRHEYFITI